MWRDLSHGAKLRQSSVWNTSKAMGKEMYVSTNTPASALTAFLD